MELFILELGVVLAIAAILGLVSKKLNQPVILGFIVAGFLASLFLAEGGTSDVLEMLAKLGIAFLLFLLGVELDIKEVKEVGPTAMATGIGQVAVTFIVGFLLSHFLFGFEMVESAYIAIALTFSSTIVIIKLLGEKGDLNSLYGRIAVGLLIVQDLIAVIALIALNSMAGTGDGNIVVEILRVIFVGGLLVALAVIVGRMLEIVLSKVGKSTEILLLFVLAWALIFSFLARYVGFSIEVGAFLAGIVLATSPLSTEITAKVKPLRDFFIIIFFVVLGMGLSLDGVVQNIPQILLLSIFVLIGNPLILLSIMGAMGYHRRISFLTGLTVSQISEFSLIIVATGVALGQVGDDTLSIVTGVAIITLIGSSYFISHGDALYEKLKKPLIAFQRKSLVKHHHELNLANDKVVIIGAHRMGSRLVDALAKRNIDMLVIDYDPKTVSLMLNRGIDAVYGDLGDLELVDELDQPEVKLIVSTVPGYEDNLLLLEKISKFSNKPTVIVRAENNKEAQELKKHGADMVLIPERIAGDKIVELILENELIEELKPKNNS